MAQINAAKSGSFKIGGDITIHRLGYGAMRITGEGIWGPPKDRAEALRTLKRVPELGIDFIDTADSYGPDISEQLIREALHPYDNMLIATKAGFRRSGPGQWQMDGRPDYLRAQALKSCKQLGVEQIDCGSSTASTPRCRVMSNSTRSGPCSMTASSVTRA
jgi:pyridoxine 4-dehydrogenase